VSLTHSSIALNIYEYPRRLLKKTIRHVDQHLIEKSIHWLKTPRAEISIKERPSYAEWAIAEAKNLHGLSSTRYRGLEKVAIQCLLMAAVQNISRLVRHIWAAFKYLNKQPMMGREI
jgi:hypothetical protein